MKKIVFLLFILVFTKNIYAHEDGHGTPTTIWRFVNSDKTIKANFIKKVDEIIYLSNKNQEILTFNYFDFEKETQQYILERVHWTNSKNTSRDKQSILPISNSDLLVLIGIALLLFAIFNLNRKKNFWTYSSLGIVFIFWACTSSNTAKNFVMAANEIPFLESIFGVFDKVETRYDEQYFYIESDGIPEHEMMTGITSWQQQLPVNHDYSGNNAWAIPLQPELAESPISTKTNFMKGAIAIAANGIPIFNPLNNRGEDAKAFGELDRWGGHSGRADDYHYHLPPTHLQAKVGEDKPIAYALDGFPVYGETTKPLDGNLGRFTSDRTYQYHAVKEYPYLIAAMRGKVEIDPSTHAPENEIMPQAKTRGVRPHLRPLRGAKIIGFKNPSSQQYSLTYQVGSLVHTVNYGWDDSGNYTYEFINPDGTSTKSNYKRK